MTDRKHEHRRWSRHTANNNVRFKSNGRSRNGQLNDISASGVAFNLEAGDSTEEKGRLTIDNIGDYDAQIIRDMEDGFAATLNLDEDEQTALHQELSVYFHDSDDGYD